MGALDDQQKDVVKQWLRSLGGIGDGFRCSGCNSGRLMEPTLIITLPESGKMQVIPLTCDKCARVTFLNTKSLGI
jgi:hypothetical protein